MIFEPTAKSWKRVLLVVLAVAGAVLVLIHGFTVPFVGFVLSGLTFAACLLWFDSGVRNAQDRNSYPIHQRDSSRWGIGMRDRGTDGIGLLSPSK